MAYLVAGRLTGLKDVLDRLARLSSQTTRGKILRRALDQATKPILDAAKAAVAQRSGLLRKSLGRKVRTYRQSGKVVVAIGPRSGFRRQIEQGRGGKLRVVSKKKQRKGGVYANPNRYAHLVELGTKRSRAAPFLRPAFSRMKGVVLGTLRRLVIEGIEAAAK